MQYPVHSSESRQISVRNLPEGLRESHELYGSTGDAYWCQAKCVLSLPGIICIYAWSQSACFTFSSERRCVVDELNISCESRLLHLLLSAVLIKWLSFHHVD